MEPTILWSDLFSGGWQLFQLGTLSKWGSSKSIGVSLCLGFPNFGDGRDVLITSFSHAVWCVDHVRTNQKEKIVSAVSVSAL